MNKEISTPVAIACFAVMTAVTVFFQKKNQRDFERFVNDANQHIADCRVESDRMMQNLVK